MNNPFFVKLPLTSGGYVFNVSTSSILRIDCRKQRASEQMSGNNDARYTALHDDSEVVFKETYYIVNFSGPVSLLCGQMLGYFRMICSNYYAMVAYDRVLENFIGVKIIAFGKLEQLNALRGALEPPADSVISWMLAKRFERSMKPYRRMSLSGQRSTGTVTSLDLISRIHIACSLQASAFKCYRNILSDDDDFD